MGIEYADVKNNLVVRDESLTWRWFDGFGPNVVKLIEDWVSVPADDTTTYPTAYTSTAVEVGAGSSTAVATNAAGGALLITAAANENDGIQIQLTGENYQLNGKYPCYFGIKLQAGDVDQSDFIVGLCITDSTLIANGMTDGAYFRSADGAATVQFILEKDSVEASTTAATMTDATDITLEYYYDGTSITAYVDGVQVASVADTDASFPDDELLTPSIAFLTGEAVANTMTVAWMRAIQVRG